MRPSVQHAVRRRGRRSSPATAEPHCPGALADEIRRVFKLFDDDETGRISFRNLKRVARELGENMTDEELQEMINKADLDGDGEVNEDEFMRIMTCKQTLALQTGLGGRKDEAEARRLFGLAAAQGDALAQFKLGNMLYEGHVVSKDEAEARRLFGLAAVQGHANAQCTLGLMHVKGHGGTKDEAEGCRLLGLAAAQGHEQAREAQDVLAARREKEAKKAERRTQKKQNRRMKYAAASASVAGESPEAARQRIETQLVRAATEEDEALEATRVAAEERRKRERRTKEREEEAAARQCQIQQREYELELMQAASKQRAAATPAKAKRGGEGLDGKEVTQKTQSISRALEHSEELRQREAARVEEAARQLEIRRMADQIQRGE